MKRYNKEEMVRMDGIAFAKDIIKGEKDSRGNPNTPLAHKLGETLAELDIIEEAKLTYSQLKAIFQVWEKTNPKKHLAGYIVFTNDSFTDNYGIMSRAYCVSSDNKAFQPNMGGYSIYGSSLNGDDRGVRLEQYMAEEKAGKDGWKVEYCLLLGYRK